MNRKKGYILTITGGLCWAIGGVCGQCLFQLDGITSNWLVPYRLLISGIVMLVVSAVTGNNIFSIWKDRQDAVRLLIFGLIGSALTQYGYYSSVQYSNAAVGTVLSYISPVFILLWTIIKNRRIPRVYEWVSVLCVLAGTIAIATHGQFGELSLSAKALIWGIIGAIGFSVYTLQPQKLLKKRNLMTVIGWGMVIGGIMLMLICRPWRIEVEFSLPMCLRFAGVIILGTICSFCLYQAGAKIVGGLAASVLSSVEPAASVVISVFVLSMKFHWMDFVGFVLILATIPLIAFGDRKFSMTKDDSSAGMHSDS